MPPDQTPTQPPAGATPPAPQEAPRAPLRAVPDQPSAQDQVNEVSIEALKFALAEARAAAEQHKAASEQHKAAAQWWREIAESTRKAWYEERAEHQRDKGIVLAQQRDMQREFTNFVQAVSNASEGGGQEGQSAEDLFAERVIGVLKNAKAQGQRPANNPQAPQGQQGGNGGSKST